MTRAFSHFYPLLSALNNRLQESRLAYAVGAHEMHVHILAQRKLVLA
jgi:hypothetical protein